MTVAAPRSDLGRQVFGLAALAFGILTLVRHDYRDWVQLRLVLNAGDGPLVIYAAGAVQIAGGIALQFRRTVKVGAALLGAVYLLFAVSFVPRIVAAPLVYDRWGNFFEQLALATGPAILFARASSARAAASIRAAGRIVFGLCVASFSLEQAFLLDATAGLVPKWIPPNQMFWALATTAAFGLAAAALLANRAALLASRLLTVMIALFGVLVWIPLLAANPRSRTDWSECIETFAIAGVAWILADLLAARRFRTR